MKSNTLHLQFTFVKPPPATAPQADATSMSITATYTPPAVRARHRRFDVPTEYQNDPSIDALFDEVTALLEQRLAEAAHDPQDLNHHPRNPTKRTAAQPKRNKNR